MPTAEEAAALNAQYRAQNNLAPDSTNTAILSTPQAQQYIAQRDAIAEQAKHDLAFSQPRSDIPTGGSAEFNAILAQYEQQRGNTVGSGGAYRQSTSAPTPKNPFAADSAAGIAWEVAKSGGTYNPYLGAKAEAQAEQKYPGNTEWVGIHTSADRGVSTVPMRDLSYQGTLGESIGTRTLYVPEGNTGIKTKVEGEIFLNRGSGEITVFGSNDRGGKQIISGAGAYGAQSGMFTFDPMGAVVKNRDGGINIKESPSYYKDILQNPKSYSRGGEAYYGMVMPLDNRKLSTPQTITPQYGDSDWWSSSVAARARPDAKSLSVSVDGKDAFGTVVRDFGSFGNQIGIMDFPKGTNVANFMIPGTENYVKGTSMSDYLTDTKSRGYDKNYVAGTAYPLKDYGYDFGGGADRRTAAGGYVDTTPKEILGREVTFTPPTPESGRKFGDITATYSMVPNPKYKEPVAEAALSPSQPTVYGSAAREAISANWIGAPVSKDASAKRAGAEGYSGFIPTVGLTEQLAPSSGKSASGGVGLLGSVIGAGASAVGSARGFVEGLPGMVGSLRSGKPDESSQFFRSGGDNIRIPTTQEQRGFVEGYTAAGKGLLSFVSERAPRLPTTREQEGLVSDFNSRVSSLPSTIPRTVVATTVGTVIPGTQLLAGYSAAKQESPYLMERGESSSRGMINYMGSWVGLGGIAGDTRETTPSKDPLRWENKTTVSGGNATITNMGAYLENPLNAPDLYNKESVDSYNAKVATYNAMSKQNPIVTTIESKQVGTPDTVYQFGEWSKVNERAGEFMRTNVYGGFTKEQYKAYEPVVTSEKGLSGDVNRLKYGALGFLTTEPANVLPIATAGALTFLGGEVVGVGVSGLAASKVPVASAAARAATAPQASGILGNAAKYTYEYGGKAAMVGLGAWQVTEGFTATKEKTEINIGYSAVPAVAFSGGYGALGDFFPRATPPSSGGRQMNVVPSQEVLSTMKPLSPKGGSGGSGGSNVGTVNMGLTESLTGSFGRGESVVDVFGSFRDVARNTVSNAPTTAKAAVVRTGVYGYPELPSSQYDRSKELSFIRDVNAPEIITNKVPSTIEAFPVRNPQAPDILYNEKYKHGSELPLDIYNKRNPFVSIPKESTANQYAGEYGNPNAFWWENPTKSSVKNEVANPLWYNNKNKNSIGFGFGNEYGSGYGTPNKNVFGNRNELERGYGRAYGYNPAATGFAAKTKLDTAVANPFVEATGYEYKQKRYVDETPKQPKPDALKIIPPLPSWGGGSGYAPSSRGMGRGAMRETINIRSSLDSMFGGWGARSAPPRTKRTSRKRKS